MTDFIQNVFFNSGRYKTHSQAVIISCFFNPQHNPYRLLCFQKWYRSIKHLNYRIVECLIGPDAKPQLPQGDPNITRVRTKTLLWHKETLLNRIVSQLPEKFQYVFWVDADVIFANDRWLVDAVEQLADGTMILQPFEYCIHLERDQLQPDFDVEAARQLAHQSSRAVPHQKRMWRSFCANHVTIPGRSANTDYDVHGHVGFAWGARRQVLEDCPLYDRALIGGADHIIAHAAAGQIPHPCITHGFADNLEEVLDWSKKFFRVVGGKIGYVPGDLYHLWHGSIAKRQYLKRIKDYTSTIAGITERDEHGLHVARPQDKYVRRYYRKREISPVDEDYDYQGFDGGFFEDMGYWIRDLAKLFGLPQLFGNDDDDDQEDDPTSAGQPAEVSRAESHQATASHRAESHEWGDQSGSASFAVDDMPADASQPENSTGSAGDVDAPADASDPVNANFS